MTFPRFRSWLDATLLRSRMEREMDAELRLHMEHHAEHLMRGGLSAPEAQRQARLEFGGFEQTKEACRDARGAGLLEDLLRDLSFGLRMMRRNPWFSAVAVLTLGMGIGATTTVFSLVNAALLRALPYHEPQRLAFLYQPNPGFQGVPLARSMGTVHWRLLRFPGAQPVVFQPCPVQRPALESLSRRSGRPGWGFRGHRGIFFHVGRRARVWPCGRRR